MIERRKEPRTRSYLGGRIAFNGRRSTADCLIRNTSASGARLVVDNNAFVPDTFELHVPQRQAGYRARMKWRSISEAGVEIERFADAGPPIPLEPTRRLKQLEHENAFLRRRLTGETD
jgi:hypothetical protein